MWVLYDEWLLGKYLLSIKFRGMLKQAGGRLASNAAPTCHCVVWGLPHQVLLRRRPPLEACLLLLALLYPRPPRFSFLLPADLVRNCAALSVQDASGSCRTDVGGKTRRLHDEIVQACTMCCFSASPDGDKGYWLRLER